MTSRATRVPSIPEIRSDNVTEVLQAIKDTLQVREGRTGDPLDQAATLRDLVSLNLAEDGTLDGGSTNVVGGTGSIPIIPILPPGISGYNPEIDYTTPPAPTGLAALGGFSNVFLSWSGAPYRNHSYTEVWRANEDNLGSAVLIGTTSANVYADPAQPNTTYYYWVRFVSRANITGPYNQTSGTPATTAIDVGSVLPTLTNEIAGSQLFVDLGTRIQQIREEQVLSASQLSALSEARGIFEAQLSQNASASFRLTRITDEQATSISLLGTRVGSAESNITTLQSTTASQATSLTSLTTRVGTAESNITSLQTTTANQATSISTLTSSVSGNTTSIQTLQTTTNGLSGQYTVKIDNNGHVSGFGLASTVVNGTPTSAFIVRADRFAIAGANDTTDPLGTLTPTNVPFVVLTTPTNIGGITYPAGVWMKTAFIADATIQSAKIESLVADKITTGSLTAAVGITTGRISGGVNTAFSFGSTNFGTGFYLGNDSGTYKFYVGSPTQNMNWNGTALTVTGAINATSGAFRNVTIYGTNDVVLLSSGGIPNTAVTGLGTLATQNTVSTGQVTGLGTLATQNTVSTAQVTGLGTLATANSVNWNTQITNIPAFGNFAYLSTITSANISTYIQSAAIGTAYIANAAITNALIANLAVDNAKINDLNVSKLTAGSLATSQYIQSSNYSPGGNGFRINADGTAEFGQVTVRGNITANSVTANSIVTTSIQGQQVTEVYSANTTGYTLTVNVVVPANASSVIILGSLGNGSFASGGEGSSFYTPPYGDLTIAGTTVLNNCTQSIVWSVGSPGAGTYSINVVRGGTASGTMTLSVLVTKR